MNDLISDPERNRDVSRLKLVWYSMLPGAIIVMMAALYAWMRTTAYSAPVVSEMLAENLPLIFGTAVVSGAGLALFLRSRLPVLAARSPAGQPFQRASAATFIVLGAADAPALVGIGLYLMNPADWLAAAIVFYAFAAGLLFKPDFVRLLAHSNGAMAGTEAS